MRIDPVPFIAWFDAQAAVIGAQGVLSRIGWEDEAADRRIRRWRAEATDVDALDVVDALHAAGVDFDDVYDAPGHAETRAWVAAEPDGELGREWTARRKLGKPVGVHGRMTEAQVRAAHVLYVQQGLSFRALGALLWERFSYATPKACANSLCDAFRTYGLPSRERIEATKMASTIHGLATREHRAASTPEYRAHRAKLRRASGEIEDRPYCAGVRAGYPQRGAPCRNRAQVDSDYCVAHDPARRTEVLEILTDARQHRDRAKVAAA